MKILRWLSKKKLSGLVNVIPGDTISLTSKGKTLLTTDITKSMAIEEVRTFEAKVDDRRAIGGIYIERKKPSSKKK